jgi:hypothetical protein
VELPDDFWTVKYAGAESACEVRRYGQGTLGRAGSWTSRRLGSSRLHKSKQSSRKLAIKGNIWSAEQVKDGVRPGRSYALRVCTFPVVYPPLVPPAEQPPSQPAFITTDPLPPSQPYAPLLLARARNNLKVRRGVALCPALRQAAICIWREACALSFPAPE